jgi:hypothetical protein
MQKRGILLALVLAFVALLAIVARPPLSAIGLQFETTGTPLFVPLVLQQLASTPTATATESPVVTHVPSATATPTQPAQVAAVAITHIEYDPPGDEVHGEYVNLNNQGGTTAVMTDWTLCDLANHCYTFPVFSLAPGAQVKVWTRGGTNTATDLFQDSASPIWNNDSDTATLRDQNSAVVDVFSY